MAIKVYISGICGSQEVRKQQQRVLFILQSMPIDLQVIDITEPGKDDDLVFIQETAKKHDKKTQLPPQIFNDNEYCGDYDDFELANDDDEIMKFLKLETGPSKVEMLQSGDPASETITQNGIGNHEEISENVETNAKIDTDTAPQENELSSEDKVNDLEGSDNIQTEASAHADEKPVEKVAEEEKKESSEEESEEESE